MFSFFKKKSQCELNHQFPKSHVVGSQDQTKKLDQYSILLNTTEHSWLVRLKNSLVKTSSNFKKIFSGVKIDDNLYIALEESLLVADVGVETTDFLLAQLKKEVQEKKITQIHDVHFALLNLVFKLLEPLQKSFLINRYKPLVIMIVGVNGVGKTTTIGKFAHYLSLYKQSVLLAACDTFRAAAYEQLIIWSKRNNVSVIAQKFGNPAAIAFDAVHAAQARNVDVVLVDTAGRLPTQLHLMNELKKIKRVLSKSMLNAPHEIVLVIDGHAGQNALVQVQAFNEALNLTGLIVTKLDGTAKGGMLAAIAHMQSIPVYFIGAGEQIDDLHIFNAQEFSNALFDKT